LNVQTTQSELSLPVVVNYLAADDPKPVDNRLAAGSVTRRPSAGPNCLRKCGWRHDNEKDADQEGTAQFHATSMA
jgi:hypothetical protein